MERPECKCKGTVCPGAMCGFVIVSTNKCGAPESKECEHRGGFDRGGRRNQNNEGDLVDNS
jgi:hypothetical protein